MTDPQRPQPDRLLMDLISSTAPGDKLGHAAIERIRNLTAANEGLAAALRTAEAQHPSVASENALLRRLLGDERAANRFLSNDWPTADWAGAWAAVSGYLQQAADDGTVLDTGALLDYMGELKRKALRASFARAGAVAVGPELSPTALDPPICTDPDCTIKRKPGQPMHGPHNFRAAVLDTTKEPGNG